jgi:hypothetical protein
MRPDSAPYLGEGFVELSEASFQGHRRSGQTREEVTALHCGEELFFLTWPALVNPLENEIGVRDGVRNGALPRRAWLGTYFVKFPGCQDRCGEKDCVFPLFIH